MRKALIGVITTCVALFGVSGEEVAKRAYEQTAGYGSSIATTTMILKNATGDANKRKLLIKRLEGKNGDRSLLEFLYPNDLKGTKLLSYEVIGGDDKQWLYLPALKRVKRISSRNKSGSFMGSEFSYEDISSQNYKNYTYPSEAKKVFKDGIEYFEVVRIPKDEHSGYSKQIFYIDTKENLTRFGKMYDKNGRLLKKIYFENYVTLDGVKKAHKIVIENLQNNKKSILLWESENPCRLLLKPITCLA